VRGAGYLQSLPKEQNWHGNALLWGTTLCDPLSSHNTDGRRAELGSLDLDSDAVEARQWPRRMEAETHLLLPDPPRTPLHMSFYWSRSDKLTMLRLTLLISYDRAAALASASSHSMFFHHAKIPDFTWGQGSKGGC
jgi:hypothetical protein